MNIPLQTVLIPRDALQQRIEMLAEEINRFYAGQDLVLISLLKGSILFLSDLMKELKLDLEIGFLYLSSYQGKTTPQTDVRHFSIPFPDIQNRHVLLVEDILDTGASLDYAIRFCEERLPLSLRTCILLVKDKSDRVVSPPVDFKGFNIPDEFVIGYGLDFQEKYRNLPYIAIPDFGEK